MVENQVQLQEGRSAQSVDQADHRVSRGQSQVVDDTVDQAGGHLGGLGDAGPFHPRLTVDADTDLHLTLVEIEGVTTGRRQMPRCQGCGHGPGVVGDGPGDAGDFIERVAPVGGGAGDLLDENRRPGPAATRSVRTLRVC